MPGCSVFYCSNSNEKGFKLFHFPTNNERRALWAKKCVRGKDWKPTRNMCICEVHFEDSQFELNADGLRKLKPNAVPTLFNNAIPVFYRREKSNRKFENTNQTQGRQKTRRQMKNNINTSTLPANISASVSKKRKLEGKSKINKSEERNGNISTDVSSITHSVTSKSKINNQIILKKEIKIILPKIDMEKDASITFKDSAHVSKSSDLENEDTNQKPGLQKILKQRELDKNTPTISTDALPGVLKDESYLDQKKN